MRGIQSCSPLLFKEGLGVVTVCPMSRIYILTGPSGVGKTTIARELLKRIPTLKKVVTCTTRPIRPQETEGVDYFFLSEDEMKRLIDSDETFEWANVYDRFYASRTADVRALLDSNNDVLFVIDIQGAQTIKRERPETIVIFIAPQSTEELFNRLLRRDHGQTINADERRTALEKEMAFSFQCDHVVINPEGKLTETIDTIDKIIQNR